MTKIYEPYLLESSKRQKLTGRKAQKCFGCSAKRRPSPEWIPVLEDRAPSVPPTKYMRKATVKAILKVGLPPDTMVSTVSHGSTRQVVKSHGLERNRVAISSGAKAMGARHIQNVDRHHAKLQGRMQRLNEVDSIYLDSDPSRVCALERSSRSLGQPA